MLKVGRYLNPMLDDLLFGDWTEAHAYARELAQQSDTTPGKHDETLCLFLDGEEFRRV